MPYLHAEVIPIQTSWHVITHLVDFNGPGGTVDGQDPPLFAYTDDTSGIAPGQDLPWVPFPLSDGAYYTRQPMGAQDVFLLHNLHLRCLADIPDQDAIEEYQEIHNQGGFLPIIEADLTGSVEVLDVSADAEDEDEAQPDEHVCLDDETRQMHADSTIVLWVVLPGDLNTEALEAYLQGDYQGARFMVEAPNGE